MKFARIFKPSIQLIKNKGLLLPKETNLPTLSRSEIYDICDQLFATASPRQQKYFHELLKRDGIQESRLRTIACMMKKEIFINFEGNINDVFKIGHEVTHLDYFTDEEVVPMTTERVFANMLNNLGIHTGNYPDYHMVSQCSNEEHPDYPSCYTLGSLASIPIAQIIDSGLIQLDDIKNLSRSNMQDMFMQWGLDFKNTNEIIAEHINGL